MIKIGSLCTGYGGLDMAVEAYFDAEMVWCAEIDKFASQLIKQRFDKPNHGDIKTIQWDQVEPINVLTAGYPCQPFSHAGDRKGVNDERHLWPYIKEAISSLRPGIVVLENVRGHLSLGFDQVLADLTEIGYDTSWEIVRASDVGAPHQRARLFVIAYPTSERCADQFRTSTTGRPEQSTTTYTDSNAREESRRTNRGLSEPSIRFQNGKDEGQARHEYRFSRTMEGQNIPNTLDEVGRLNPLFVEYMMGLMPGWVTDLGLSRSQQLKMLGNGVVPQQAYYALEILMRHALSDNHA
jgi:DNA (cytosine-5)-methyltransferase 1